MKSPGKLFITVAFLVVGGCETKEQQAMPTVPSFATEIEAQGVTWEEMGGRGVQLTVQKMTLDDELNEASLLGVKLQVGELEMAVDRAEYYQGVLRGSQFKLGRGSFWIGGKQFELDLQTNVFSARDVGAAWDGSDNSSPGRQGAP